MREIKTRDLPFPSPSSSTWYIRLIYATVNVSPYFGVYKTPYKDCEKKFFSVLQKTCSARGHGCSAVSSTAWRLTGKICGLPQKETGTQDRPFTLKSETISPSRRYGRHSIVEAALLWNRRKNSAWNKEKNESAFRGCVCDWKEMLRHCDLNKLIRSTFFSQNTLLNLLDEVFQGIGETTMIKAFVWKNTKCKKRRMRNASQLYPLTSCQWVKKNYMLIHVFFIFQFNHCKQTRTFLIRAFFSESADKEDMRTCN